MNVLERLRSRPPWRFTHAMVRGLVRLIEAMDRYQLARDAALNTGVGLCGSCDMLYREDGGMPPCNHCAPLMAMEQRTLEELRAARRALEETTP